MNIGERIKQARLEKGLDQLALCEKLSIEQSTLSNYENGRRIPKPDMIVKMADIFGVSTDYLLGKTDLRNYNDYKATITDKDERNIQRELEKMMDDIVTKNPALPLMVVSWILMTMTENYSRAVWNRSYALLS